LECFQRTEERLRILLSDKASLDLKFKEEMEQGNNDRKRLQHLLEVEKAKLEASEKVLKDVGLNYVMFLNKAAHDPKQNDVLEKNRITAVPVAMEHDETQGISTVELEKQPRIEENKSIFNNSAETAEENSSHHLKNVIEMEEFQKLLGTDTFLGIIAVLQDDEKEILVSEFCTLFLSKSLSSLYSSKHVIPIQCPLSISLCLQGYNVTSRQVTEVFMFCLGCGEKGTCAA
jgi:hypothetical protein